MSGFVNVGICCGRPIFMSLKREKPVSDNKHSLDKGASIGIVLRYEFRGHS